MWDFQFIPEQASTIAREVDTIYFVLIGMSGFISFGVAGLILYFVVKYRATSDAERSHVVTGNTPLELAWMVIPLLLALGMFTWAARSYFHIKSPPPEEPLEVYAIGKQWMWKFQHPNGAREINELHVPVGQTVKMIMTSQDVIHSFFVPAFRVKQDVVPGLYTNTWFKATKTGRYHLFCTEYCGTDHSVMGGYVRVMEQAEYEEWLRKGKTGGSYTEPGTGRFGRAPTGVTDEPVEPGPWGDDLPAEEQPARPQQAAMAAAGEQLFRELRCVTCHRPDSSSLYPDQGPSLYNLYGQPIELQNNRTVIADEQYIRESILYPQNKIVLGYPPIMPTFKGQITEEELMQLVAYIKSLGPPGAAPGYGWPELEGRAPGAEEGADADTSARQEVP